MIENFTLEDRVESNADIADLIEKIFQRPWDAPR